MLLAAAGLGIFLLLALGVWQRREADWPESLAAGSARGFNVLLVTLDTTRADRIGCYGYAPAQTPVIDGLSRAGIRFDDAVAVTPMTLPSHTTILTGLSPQRHGVRNNGGFTLDDVHETLAEVLSSRGFETAAFVSAFVLDSQFGLAQGFSVYDDEVETAHAQPGGLIHRVNERRAAGTTDAALRWFRTRERERPYFGWVHYYDPHRPFDAPPPFARRFPDEPYDAEIAYADAQLGRLLDGLRAIGQLDRTLLVVVGDHGEGMGDHGEEAHSTLIYDSVMRVPLVLSCPAVFESAHVVDNAVVSIADVFPTVLDLLGMAVGSNVDGKSLRSARTDTERAIYMENLATYFDNGWAPLYGLRRHTEKYILAPRPEFYLLAPDPSESNNVYASVSGKALVARDRLIADLDMILTASPTLADVRASVQPLDVEGIQALQSLGYVGLVADVGDPTLLADPKDMMSVVQAIGRANTLSSNRRYEEALAILEQAFAISPRHKKLPMMIGQLHLYLGHVEEALRLLRDAMPDTPASEVAMVAAQTLNDAGETDLAIEVLERARENSPEDVRILVRLGVAYMNTERNGKALAILVAAEERDSSLLEVNINLAACHRRMGNLYEALRYAERVIADSPDTAQAHLTRGLILKELRREAEALASLERAWALDPRNPAVVQELANVCMRLGRHTDAVAHFHALSELLPTRWEPHLGLAQAYYMAGDLDQAEAQVRLGLKLAPGEPRLRAMAGRLAEQRSP